MECASKDNIANDLRKCTYYDVGVVTPEKRDLPDWMAQWFILKSSDEVFKHFFTHFFVIAICRRRPVTWSNVVQRICAHSVSCQSSHNWRHWRSRETHLLPPFPLMNCLSPDDWGNIAETGPPWSEATWETPVTDLALLVLQAMRFVSCEWITWINEWMNEKRKHHIWWKKTAHFEQGKITRDILITHLLDFETS
jgi:hypothetical protein